MMQKGLHTNAETKMIATKIKLVYQIYAFRFKKKTTKVVVGDFKCKI